MDWSVSSKFTFTLLCSIDWSLLGRKSICKMSYLLYIILYLTNVRIQWTNACCYLLYCRSDLDLKRDPNTDPFEPLEQILQLIAKVIAKHLIFLNSTFFNYLNQLPFKFLTSFKWFTKIFFFKNVCIAKNTYLRLFYERYDRETAVKLLSHVQCLIKTLHYK